MSGQPSSQESLAVVLAFQRQTNELLADEVQPIDVGWLVRTPSRPHVWMLNHVRVVSAVSYEQAAALCRVHQPQSAYHHLYIEEEAGGQTLAEEFRREGWEVDVELHSVLRNEPDRLVDTGRVVELTEDEGLSLMERWLAEDKTLGLNAVSLQELVETNRVTWRARHARCLGVRGPDGRPVALTMLFSDGRVAQVEDVYTIPEARGRGHARALVTKAIALAREGGHELTFIVADDGDSPKELYGKLGFVPVGRTWMFHHRLSGS